MHSLFHLLRLARDPAHPGSEILRIVARKDVQWNRPVFKAPSLPTPQQLGGDLPFSAHFHDRNSRLR
ncbi:MAG TPA: hypothetical protein VK717_03885 [Opitutaceae bacterium]|jgi:hypothetical protein|nr:hypothetical protein [Opitutaceae bacterium]